MAILVTHCAKVSIVQCYAQISDYNDVDKEVIYKQLQDVVNKVPCHDILLIIGNMNVQIRGSRSRYGHVLGLYAFGKQTDNGERFF